MEQIKKVKENKENKENRENWLTIEERKAQLRANGMEIPDTIVMLKEKPLKYSHKLKFKIKQILKKEENEEKSTDPYYVKKKLSGFTKLLKSSTRELEKLNKKIEKEQESEKKYLTCADVIKNRILGEANKENNNKLSILTNIADEHVKDKINTIIRLAKYLINNEEYLINSLCNINHVNNSEKIAAEILNNILDNNSTTIDELDNILNSYCTDIKKTKEFEKEYPTFKDVIMKKIINKGESQLSILAKKHINKNIDFNIMIHQAYYLISNMDSIGKIYDDNGITEITPKSFYKILLDCDNLYELYSFIQDTYTLVYTKIKQQETERTKKEENINNNTMLIQSQLAIEEISNNEKKRKKIKKEIKKTEEKENEFKKLFENKSNNITIERKKGFVDKDGKYHQFGGFHYEIKSGNTIYIIDIDNNRLSKLKSKKGGILKFEDLEECLILRTAGIVINNVGVYIDLKSRSPISKIGNNDITNKFEPYFAYYNRVTNKHNTLLDIKSNKKAFLKAFGEYVFNQEKEKETDKKFKDYKRQKTISDKPNKKGQKINYLYYVLTTEPKEIVRE